MIRNPRYVIAVQDLERSARYYRDVLGVRSQGDRRSGVRFFTRDQCVIMACECRETRRATKRYSRKTIRDQANRLTE